MSFRDSSLEFIGLDFAYALIQKYCRQTEKGGHMLTPLQATKILYCVVWDLNTMRN